MIDEVLYVEAVEAIGVSHDGRRDPTWNGILDYASEDDEIGRLTSHGREMIEMKVRNFQSTVAEHQNNRLLIPK
jgi:hypothetical protein